jgi:hypothetical protein
MKRIQILDIGSGCRNSRLPIAAFLVFPVIVVAQACFADTNHLAIGVGEILHRVEAATVPPRTYSATVHQAVTRTNTPSSTTSLAGQSSLTEEQDYVVNCTTSGVVRASKGISLRQLPQMATATSTSGPSGGGGGGHGNAEVQPSQNATAASTTNAPTSNMRMLITMNPINALRHIEKIGSATIADDVDQNIPCYKISAMDNHFGFILWVSKTDASVCRQIVLQDSNTLFDAQFEYTKWNGTLVPSHVVITRPANGIRVTQDYSGHTF